MNTPRGLGFRQEGGSGTVSSLAIISVLIFLLMVIHILSAVSLAKGQADRSADLAALAAADTARGLNVGDPCAVAEQVVATNDATLDDCLVGGEFPTEVRVHVSRDVQVALLPAQLTFPQLRAASTSRAGPPEALP